MIKTALKTSLPILFGFVPLGIAFGLLAAGVGLVEIAMSTFLLNSRHMFYGIAFLESFGNWNLRKLYMIFGLTDETYALMTSINVPNSFNKKKYFFFITLFAQFYWVLGCTIGALSSEILSFNTEGMEFAATALFVVLLIEQWIMVKRILPFMIGFIASFIALMFFINHMLIVAIIISIGSILIFRLVNKSHDE